LFPFAKPGVEIKAHGEHKSVLRSDELKGAANQASPVPVDKADRAGRDRNTFTCIVPLKRGWKIFVVLHVFGSTIM
jgi:hypothetical protein